MAVAIKHIHVIRPAGETPSGIMYLSESDQAISMSHTPTIYIYKRPSTTQPFKTLIQNLITSLSKILIEFYPLAGRLHNIPNSGGRLELHCNAEGVTLIEAESDLRVEDLGDFCPSPLMSALIPKVDYATKPIHETPIVLGQVTRLACGAITFGFAISHTVLDGQSVMFFISEWCKLARGVVDPVRPFLDRTILKPSAFRAEENGDYDYVRVDYSPPLLLVGRSDDAEERMKETALSILKLSAEQVAELKSKANLVLSGGGRPYTRCEAISAHIWRCSSKARRHTPLQPTRLRIVTNARNRVKPPLPPTFFGNMVLRIAIDTTSDELLNSPLGHISSKIRKKVNSVDDKYVRDALAYLEKQPDVTRFRNFHSVGRFSMGGFFGNPNFEITSWLSLPMYGNDFGWGPQDYMGPGQVGYDGKCFILPGHDGDKSVVVLVRLQVESMEEFNKCFYEDI